MGKLSLDLGSKTGYCIINDNGEKISGRVTFKTSEKKQKKYFKFQEWLFSVFKEYNINKVFYEKVDFGLNTYSTQAHGAYVATIHTAVNTFMVSKNKKIEVKGYNVNTIKKKLTGRGNATKMGMIHYAEKWIGRTITDDNEADAIGVMVTALKDGK